MSFKFNTEMTPGDYWEFCKFTMFKDPKGKKTILFLRILVAFIGVWFSAQSFWEIGFSREGVIYLVRVVVVIVAFELLLVSFLKGFTKLLIKFRGKGETFYHPNSVLSFDEEGLSEDIPDIKLEFKYSKIDRAFIVENKAIYFCVGYPVWIVLPFSSFESKEQMGEFIDFIKNKLPNIKTCN